MSNKKKKLLISGAVLAFLIMLPFLISGANSLLIRCGVLASDKNVLNGFYESELHYDEEGWQDFTDYCEFHYKEKHNQKFADNAAYTRVGMENAERLRSYLHWFSSQAIIYRVGYEEWFPSDLMSKVDADDYFIINVKSNNFPQDDFENYDIYFYDTQTSTLYFMHENI